MPGGLLVGGLSETRPLIDSERHRVGGAETLPPDDRLRAVVFLKGDDDVATVVTIALDAEPAAVLDGTTDIVRARALISWGTGGHLHQAEIDVVRGTMISLQASSVKVEVANESLPAATGPDLRVGATLSYLPRGGGSRPTRTRYDDNGILAAGTEDFVVPAFAAEVTYQRAPSNAPYTLRVLDSNSNVLAEFAVAGGADAPARLPLANDARTVRVVNGAVAITRSRAVFGLAL